MVARLAPETAVCSFLPFPPNRSGCPNQSGRSVVVFTHCKLCRWSVNYHLSGQSAMANKESRRKGTRY